MGIRVWLCGASNRHLCELPFDHDGEHQWTHDGVVFRWRNKGGAVRRRADRP